MPTTAKMDELKMRRLARGWTLDDLAAKADVSRSAIWKYEAGRASPSLRQLEKLAKALQTDVHHLLPSKHEQNGGV